MSKYERKLVVRAAFGLPMVALGMRVLSPTRVQSRLARSFGNDRNEVSPVEAIAAVLEAVVRRHPYRANCLERSLVLFWLLGQAGVESQIRLGVRPSDTAAPDFHAWVEVDGVVINDRPDISREFLPFDAPLGELRGRLV